MRGKSQLHQDQPHQFDRLRVAVSQIRRDEETGSPDEHGKQRHQQHAAEQPQAGPRCALSPCVHCRKRCSQFKRKLRSARHAAAVHGLRVGDHADGALPAQRTMRGDRVSQRRLACCRRHRASGPPASPAAPAPGRRIAACFPVQRGSRRPRVSRMVLNRVSRPGTSSPVPPQPMTRTGFAGRALARRARSASIAASCCSACGRGTDCIGDLARDAPDSFPVGCCIHLQHRDSGAAQSASAWWLSCSARPAPGPDARPAPLRRCHG